jgi:hypothetical protein
MEALHDGGRARLLGVSNFTLEQLQRLCDQALVPPRFVQNRCYASRGWDPPSGSSVALAGWSTRASPC